MKYTRNCVCTQVRRKVLLASDWSPQQLPLQARYQEKAVCLSTNLSINGQPSRQLTLLSTRHVASQRSGSRNNSRRRGNEVFPGIAAAHWEICHHWGVAHWGRSSRTHGCECVGSEERHARAHTHFKNPTRATLSTVEPTTHRMKPPPRGLNSCRGRDVHGDKPPPCSLAQISEPQSPRRLVSKRTYRARSHEFPPHLPVSQPSEVFVELLVPRPPVRRCSRSCHTRTHARVSTHFLLQCSLILHSGCWEAGQASRILPPTPAAS